jgi:ferredoxin|uniref:4Fe-4S dicluster domain-containing protein n=1 Tax=Candidatus Caldatribacterium californiense TaxID=1454726 RepID=A0A7V3YFW6_9BACT
MGRLRGLMVPERTVRVRINREECEGPLRCGRCLRRCPAAVFITFPRAREKGKICEDWEIAVDDTFCWGCGLCVRVCPRGAITLSASEGST